jgi:hypothetical protein
MNIVGPYFEGTVTGAEYMVPGTGAEILILSAIYQLYGDEIYYQQEGHSHINIMVLGPIFMTISQTGGSAEEEVFSTPQFRLLLLHLTSTCGVT